MRHDIPKILRALMELVPGKQTGLARRLGGGITQPQVSRWLKGVEPEVANYERIIGLAQNLGVLSDTRSEDVAATLPEPVRFRTVKLKGYVGAGSEAHFYKIADEDFEEVPAPPNATDKTVAVEIRGKSWGPFMDSFRVYYDDVHSPIDPSMYGRPCILGLADDRILLKVPFQQPNGLFRLVSNSDEPPIEDAIIEWAALVKSFMPKS